MRKSVVGGKSKEWARVRGRVRVRGRGKEEGETRPEEKTEERNRKRSGEEKRREWDEDKWRREEEKRQIRTTYERRGLAKRTSSLQRARINGRGSGEEIIEQKRKRRAKSGFASRDSTPLGTQPLPLAQRAAAQVSCQATASYVNRVGRQLQWKACEYAVHLRTHARRT